ncbi:uncharacterized protein C17orf80 homolog isoform X2 [Corythoichthys intestinalis]|uniref:uncharacterized protein C17orf80 homolog isoform X2 n=1 Tax=Corythoichthys intestinalis TaxID=161448 RepID=UPI0025A606C3|nr:uncharacterized protein C17orf80 homolog isoform X2 [Corythoichthys intestinalis]
MSPEVCPFCGKSFKRLKSHLPHCKAAKSSLSGNQTEVSPPSGQLEADLSKMTVKKKPTLRKKASPESSVKSGKGSPPSKPKKSIQASVESSHMSTGPESTPQSLATSVKSKSKDFLVVESPKPRSGSERKQIIPTEKENVAIEKAMPRITLQHVGSTLNRVKTSTLTVNIEATNTKPSPELNPAGTNINLKPKLSLLLPKNDSCGSKVTSCKPTSKVDVHQTENASVPVCFSDLQSRTRDTMTMERRKHNPLGWQWYYRRYIDVKRGGVGGISMLLAGYCVLSYVWSYPHLKKDRWRKYH